MGIDLRFCQRSICIGFSSWSRPLFPPKWIEKSCRFGLFWQNVELRGPGASYPSQVDLATWISPNRGPSETDMPEVSMENL